MLSTSKMVVQMRNTTKWALPSPFKDLGLCVRIKLNCQLHICSPTTRISFKLVNIYCFPWYVKIISSTGLLVLFHILTSAKPIALCTITQDSKTDYSTTTHDRPFQVICLKIITRPTQRGQGSDCSPQKKSSIMLHFGVTHKLLAFWNWEVYNQVSYVSHLLFDVSEPCTTQIVPACGTAQLRWSSPGQEQVCKSWCTLPCHKHWNLLLPPLPPSFPLWRSQFLKLFNFLMWGV